MEITYKCGGCGHVFDGHWHREKERRALFPQHSGRDNLFVTMVCPKCGDTRHKRNIDFDEPPDPPAGEEGGESDV